MPRHLDINHPGLQELLRREQNGVVSRQQLLDLGATDHDIARMLRRRELHAAQPGVYVDHTGRLTRAQREWVALFTCAPAALSHESAMPGSDPSVVHVCVDQRRTLARIAGVVVHRTSHLQNRVDWHSRPPRVQPEHATIDVIEARIRSGDVAGAYAAVTRACHTREVVPRMLRAALAERKHVTQRRMVVGMIDDVEQGANSVLERGYLQLVERAHGLPRSRRQRTSHATGKRTDQHVRYEEYGVIVEPDGRAFHDSPEARDVDARRDLAERAVSGAVTLRVTYGLVFNDACRTAAWIGQVLQRCGWQGEVQRCPQCA
ncbi:type IV toxin-antitoxin system AbiEi family antitoxin domain-containing protein [Nocardioides sp. WS12]|uniref:type IV toxin-antitoxin system AbiEi family antitoxin domain-containing protein n=1 Tax=Nocardioides sp. WS12 TaxID=2486272 RepID=UPI00191DBD85|nr:type IV toxin-antitoxin system AbiEi family antitoxin domain-containing protein [Nocardioides sp. WS12]